MTQAGPTTEAKEAPTLALAEFASRLHLGDLPEHTVDRVRACTLDTIGCVIFGSTLPWSQTVNEWVRRQGGIAQASLWTTDFRGPIANVALGLGTMAHAFDIDDYHNAKLHPGAVVVPAAVAVAEARDLGGDRLLAAVAAGYEVMIRTSLAANPGPARMRGWHLTGVCGTLGAAAAAANLLDLDVSATASALGMAGTQSAGLWAFTADGSASKRFHAGRSAQSGVLAAELAELGYWGPRRILEAEDGGLLSALSPSPRLEPLVEGLGSRFHAGDTAIKPYSACGSLHSAIDAVLGLARQHALKPEEVEQIVLRTSSVVAQQCGFAFRPHSALQGQMSAQYVLAVSLADGQCLPPQFAEERMHDPDLLSLAGRVRVVQDPEIEAEYPGKFSAIVEIVLADGRRVGTKVDHPKGSAALPLSGSEVREKFVALSRRVYPEGRLAAIADRVERLEALSSVRELTGLLGR